MTSTHGRKARSIICSSIVLLLSLYQYAEYTGYFDFTISNLRVLKKSGLDLLVHRMKSNRMDEMERVRRRLPDFDGDNCMWTSPRRINENPGAIPSPIPRTLLVSSPGSGKRMAWRMLEGLTGLVAGDDWDISKEGTNVLTMKTSYPHTEGIWDWGSDFYNADVVLLLRNPRWAIPSYHTIKHELGYSLNREQSLGRVGNIYTNRSIVSDWEEWRGYDSDSRNFTIELRNWGCYIDFWMSDGQRDDEDDYCNDGGEPFQDRHCQNDIQTCQPKVLINYENLKDEDLGVFEIDKLLDALEDGEDRSNFPQTPKAARKCIFHKIQEMGEIFPQWDNKNRDRNGLKHYTRDFTWDQLNMIKLEIERLISKYSNSEYSNLPLAQQLVPILNTYHETVTMEWVIDAPDNLNLQP